jgi:hypothetical protein
MVTDSESESVTLRLEVYQQSVPLGAKHLETHNQYFFHLSSPGYSPYATSSLTRGPRQRSLSGQSPAGLMTTFYCLRFETSPTQSARYPYVYPPGTGWPDYTSRHWVPFSSSSATRRATVEAFEPASTRLQGGGALTGFH